LAAAITPDVLYDYGVNIEAKLKNESSVRSSRPSVRLAVVQLPGFP
jgi:hypothetical protein